MASLISHGVVALGAALSVAPRSSPWRFWVASIFCSCIPDGDVVFFQFGVKYEDFLGHRGFTHSILFATLFAALLPTLVFPDVPRWTRAWWVWWGYFAALTTSHGALDALTNGGLGVAFFSPFDLTRYFFPWQPIEVSPIGVRSFFSDWGLAILKAEALVVWLPTAALVAVTRGVRWWLAR